MSSSRLKTQNLLILLYSNFLYQFCLAGSYLENVLPCFKPFTSNVTLNGTFHSPDYPQSYPAKTHCRYDFIGVRPNERVQIVFTDFNLYHHERNATDCGGAEDTLSVFVYNDDKSLSRIDDFCGQNMPLIIMSNGQNRIILEFNAPTSSRYVRGFNGYYTFVKDYGIKTGKQLDNYPCSFVFNSSEASNGTVISPNYPGLYPRNTECHYLFHGKDTEYVELYFTYFHIDGVPPCDEDSHSDYVEFSNYMPIDRKFDRQCGSLREKKIKSDRKFFRVTFRSNDRFDATGFQATYQFNERSQLTMRSMRSFGIASKKSIDFFKSILLIKSAIMFIFFFFNA